MPDFKFEQNVVPVQHVDTDTSGGSGGDGGHSGALAYGYNTSHAGDGGLAVGGSGGDANGGAGNGLGLGAPGGNSAAHSDAGDANQFGLLNLNLGGGPAGGNSVAASQGGNGGSGLGEGFGGFGGTAGNGGNADASGGNATTYGVTAADSSANGGGGGDGGHADVNANQSTNVDNNFKFDHSFNEDNHKTYIDHSFNQDNHGVDNSGGIIANSVVTGDGIDHSFNTENDLHYTEVKNSFNHVEENHLADIDISHVIDFM